MICKLNLGVRIWVVCSFLYLCVIILLSELFCSQGFSWGWGSGAGPPGGSLRCGKVGSKINILNEKVYFFFTKQVLNYWTECKEIQWIIVIF